MSFPKPMEEETFWPLLLDFSFITSSSLDTSPGEPIFFFFLFLWRGGSFLGKANMGKMTSSMAMAHNRKPLHLRGRNDRWVVKEGKREHRHTSKDTGSHTDAHAYLPVANKARVTLVDVHYSFGVDVEADEDATQQVASCRSQGSHHIHDGYKKRWESIRNFSEVFLLSSLILLMTHWYLWLFKSDLWDLFITLDAFVHQIQNTCTEISGNSPPALRSFLTAFEESGTTDPKAPEVSHWPEGMPAALPHQLTSEWAGAKH